MTFAMPFMIGGLAAFGSWRIEGVKTETDRLRISVEQQQVDLTRMALENEQQARRWAVLANWIPQVINPASRTAKEARAVLFVLFPDEAVQILANAFDSLTEEERAPQQDTIDEVIQQAEDLADRTGPWTVVLGGTPDLEATSDAVTKALDLGYSPVRVYLRDDLHVVTVGDFPTEGDAESTSLVLREQILESAFVVDLAQWCPEATEEPTEDEQINLFRCPMPLDESDLLDRIEGFFEATLNGDEVALDDFVSDSCPEKATFLEKISAAAAFDDAEVEVPDGAFSFDVEDGVVVAKRSLASQPVLVNGEPLEDDPFNAVPLKLVDEDGIWRVENCGAYVSD